jgi:hypothetical protein
MGVRLIVTVLSIAGGAACAQSVEESVTGLDSCFQAARLANGICVNLTNDPARRFDCFQKVRDAHLECLEHVPSPGSVGAAAPETSSGAARAGSLPDTVAPGVGIVLPEEPGPARTGSLETPSGNTSAGQPNGPPQAIPAIPKTVPSGMPVTSSPARQAEPLRPDIPARQAAPASPDIPARQAAPARPDIQARQAEPATPDIPARQAEPARPDIPAKASDIPARPPAPDWVVSETTSPVDYSPMVTAVIRATTNAKNGPNALTIRCRGQRTELMVSTGGVWVAPRAGQLQVDYQINDQPFVRSPWTSSADGKTASYSDDPVGLLQSLAEGTRLTINISDRVNPRHEATFQLTGWDAIRKKVGATCKWTPAAGNISPGKQNSVTVGRNSTHSPAIPSIERRPTAQ